MTPEQRLQEWRWPLREHSRFILVNGHRWHYQRLGTGPTLLLLHGTGAASHSWAPLMPLLAEHFDVIAVDLPGHGLSEAAATEGMSLPGMASGVCNLLKAIDSTPVLAAGHSAGAAILAAMCLDQQLSPRAVISVNGAMLALPGMTGMFFSGSARLLAAIPQVPSWLSGLGGRHAFMTRMLDGTGSCPDPDMIERYRQLVGYPPHVAATLTMMAQWDLVSLERRLPALQTKVHLMACAADRTVPPQQSAKLHAMLADSTLLTLPNLGHLGHEEAPDLFADVFIDMAATLT